MPNLGPEYASYALQGFNHDFVLSKHLYFKYFKFNLIKIKNYLDLYN